MPARVAYDRDLADRIRELVADHEVTEQAMFGGLGFLIGGHLAVAASGRGGLMVRVDPQQGERLLREPGAAPMQMGGRRPPAGWLTVRGPVLDDPDTLARWVRRGTDYARSLPSKG